MVYRYSKVGLNNEIKKMMINVHQEIQIPVSPKHVLHYLRIAYSKLLAVSDLCLLQAVIVEQEAVDLLLDHQQMLQFPVCQQTIHLLVFFHLL
jgi:hypothetical protein